MYRYLFHHTFLHAFLRTFLVFLLITTLFSSFLFCDSPDILTSLDGKGYTYDEIVNSPKVVLMLWASWCYACKLKLKEFNQTPLNHSDADIFFINLGEKASTVEAFFDRYNLSSFIEKNILLDQYSIIEDKIWIIGIPTFVFFKDGKMIYRSYELNEELIEEVFSD